MKEKLQRLLEAVTETSPVWLDGGETIAYIRCDGKGARIWQKNLKTGERICRTTEDVRIWSMQSIPETGDIFYAADETGSECEQIYRIAPGKKDGADVTCSSGTRHFWGGVTVDGKTIAYACNLRKKQSFDIWKKDLDTGKAAMVRKNDDHYNWPCHDALSPDGRYLLYNKLCAENDNALWMADLLTGDAKRIPQDDVLSAETEPAWRHDVNGFYLLSDRGGDFVGVYTYDLASGSMQRVFSYDWDAVGISVSQDDRYLAVIVNADGYSDLHIYDMTDRSEIDFARPPKGVIGANRMNWSRDGHKLLFTLASGTCPDAVWMLDLDANAIRKISDDGMLEEDEKMLAEPVPGRFSSFDGLTVPYWLYVPCEKEPKNLPVLIEIHGGPEGQAVPSFHAFIQYLLGEGIAVVTPNVRGSTGYGKAYSHLDDVEKRLDSVRDIDSLVAHLIETGVADRSRIAVSGASYGGFMTLSCAARYPNLWACAIDTVGMYDLVTFLKNTAEYRRAHRESEYGSLERDYATLKAVSPSAVIENIRAPMMIIQGRNDPRVPVTEAEQAVAALTARGRTVKYLCYDDEGHGIAKMKNKLDCYPKMAVFLKEHLRLS